MRLSRQVRRRFWGKVTRTQRCWIWTAGKFPNGYGMFKFNGVSGGAHRMAWRLVRGPIPRGLYVCHRCDNPSCVRLSHLFLGTAADNNADARNKGRHRFGVADNRGALNGRAQLSPEDVARIRKLRRQGRKLSALSREFNISMTHVSRIARLQAWNN